MYLLFGQKEQKEDQEERFSFKAQEQSLNPCFQSNKNTSLNAPKQNENFYFFSVNEMSEFLWLKDEKMQKVHLNKQFTNEDMTNIKNKDLNEVSNRKSVKRQSQLITNAKNTLLGTYQPHYSTGYQRQLSAKDFDKNMLFDPNDQHIENMNMNREDTVEHLGSIKEHDEEKEDKSCEQSLDFTDLNMYEHSSNWSIDYDERDRRSSRANKVKISDDRHLLLSKNSQKGNQSILKSDYIQTT